MGRCQGALIAVTILLCSCFLPVHCDAAPAGSQEQEIQRLRSKVASLEDEISWSKDETSQLEDVVREKTAQIAALIGGLDALQVRNAADDESVVKSSASSALLEKQIERLGNDLEDQVKKGELLEARASEAATRLLEIGKKLERVEKINVEQRKKIEELEHKLQHSEDKLTEVERKAKLTAEQLAMVRGMCLPYWFASRSVHCQELASAKWHLHGKPVLDVLTQKVAEKLAHGQRLMEPYLQATKDASKKLYEPYITRIAAASEPHLSRARVVLGPYTKPVISAWTRLVPSTSMYHRQVQTAIGCFLEDNKLLNPHSAHRLAWWMASAMFALAMFAIYRIFWVTVRKKIQA